MSEHVKNEELLPCPFCGNKAVLELGEQDDVYVICTSCMSQTNVWNYWKDAVDIWNTRTEK